MRVHRSTICAVPRAGLRFDQQKQDLGKAVQAGALTLVQAGELSMSHILIITLACNKHEQITARSRWRRKVSERKKYDIKKYMES